MFAITDSCDLPSEQAFSPVGMPYNHFSDPEWGATKLFAVRVSVQVQGTQPIGPAPGSRVRCQPCSPLPASMHRGSHCTATGPFSRRAAGLSHPRLRLHLGGRQGPLPGAARTSNAVFTKLARFTPPTTTFPRGGHLPTYPIRAPTAGP